MRLCTLLFALSAAFPVAAQSSVATYTVRFEATWSASTHPDQFPPGPHFSPLIGATHDGAATLWTVGGTASPGIESMAETGATATLASEVNGLIGAGHAAAVLSGGGINLSPGEVSLTFQIPDTHPQVSLVSMLAPSPDWFVGVDGLALRDGSGWLSEQVVTLYAYDAGTDSGPAYTSANQDTQPQEAIALIDGAPFLVGVTVEPVGTFTFTLVNVTSNGDRAAPMTFSLGAPTPNPISDRATLRLTTPRTERVTVELFDLLGRRVRVVQDGTLQAGSHTIPLDVTNLTGGLYVIRARTGEASSIRRVTVR
ncbi:MAG: T9SS type A sorting domain-containing protein [Rhodothermaceae bacterium]|nr:T9SS type A sorting domain-containing protein [Rhodothermaceae bacterium]